MPATLSAGLLLYRRWSGGVEVLLGHPGGPFWARKDDGAWSLPKGEYRVGEDALAAARREFEEELGHPAPETPYLDLGSSRQPGGKIVSVWATEADFDPSTAVSNTFDLEWPPHSSRMQSFPEIDRVAWFTVAAARHKLLSGQTPFLDRLLAALGR